MGTVISLSENKIMEILSGYAGVNMNQEQINALVQEMYIAQQTINARMDFLDGTTLPDLIEDVAQGNIRIDELVATVIPDLDAAQEQNSAQLNDLLTVLIPTLQQDLQNTATNVNESPMAYHQAEAPLNPDDDLRDLVVGDRWFDTDDNNRQYTWNGVEWTTLSTDIPDLSITVAKFNTSTHMIY